MRGLSEPQFGEAIAVLNAEYRSQGRPYLIQAQGSGYALSLRPRFRPVAERLHGGQRAARLSPAVIDVLALVAYRQPATKQEIDTLRGIDSPPCCGSWCGAGWSPWSTGPTPTAAK